MSKIINQLPFTKCKGCSTLTRDRSGWCKVCGSKRVEYEKAIKRGYSKRYNKKTDPFYSSQAWQLKRRSYSKRFPLCQVCKFKGRIKQKNLVDHIREIKDGGSALDDDNLMSMCNQCHAVKTAMMVKARLSGGIEGVVNTYRSMAGSGGG